MSPKTTRKLKKDPFAAREAQKYDHPIASREFIIEHLKSAGAPLSFEALTKKLRVKEAAAREALRKRLGAMIRDGQLLTNRRGDYCLVERLPVVAGTVIGHRDGFGFLRLDEGGEDVFIPPRQMRALLNGDRAAMRVTEPDARGRQEGALVDVLERNTHELAGRFISEQGVSLVVPDHTRIGTEVLIPPGQENNARPGQMVAVEIIEQPSKRSQPLGRVIRVLGEHHASGMEIELAIYSHGLPHEWPTDVQTQADNFAETLTDTEIAGRTDLREHALVTIDGEDARDFDDAVYCEPRGEGWRLIVAIADVSHYVKRASPLDSEARRRGTSVYFPGRVIPMLPEILSNGLCSLNPEVDRLCLACELRIDRQGKITRSRFFEAVMRSAARLTYTEVADVLVKGDKQLRRRYAELLPRLQALQAVYGALAKARRRRGAIDFETTATRIIFGPEHEIERIVPVVRNQAHRLIEECMIAANVAAARFLTRHKMPDLYRVHAGPSAERLETLREFLGGVGLSLGGGAKPEPKHYARLIERMKDRADVELVQTVLLRSLAQAVYSPDNVGHFGLALEKYAHFTSPIRRYPDLLVHRAIRHILRGGTAQSFPYSYDQMESLGAHCSMTERRADEATRDAEDWLKAQYMLDKVGETFAGIITGVTAFGLFVTLSDLYVEGLVHVTSLSNDYYHYDATGQRLVGERSGQIYQLADPFWVQVARVSLEDRKIDFEPADNTLGGKRRRAIKRHARRRGKGTKRRRSD